LPGRSRRAAGKAQVARWPDRRCRLEEARDISKRYRAQGAGIVIGGRTLIAIGHQQAPSIGIRQPPAREGAGGIIIGMGRGSRPSRKLATISAWALIGFSALLWFPDQAECGPSGDRAGAQRCWDVGGSSSAADRTPGTGLLDVRPCSARPSHPDQPRTRRQRRRNLENRPGPGTKPQPGLCCVLESGRGVLVRSKCRTIVWV